MPHDVGMIIHKIELGFSGFTADQWNWTTIYSLYCLKGLIGDPDYDMRSNFVQACIITCSRVILFDRPDVADRYLQTFVSKFVELYGPHLHLKDCILHCCPVYTFLVFCICAAKWIYRAVYFCRSPTTFFFFAR